MNKKIYGIILAAGYSSRMSEFKPLAKYKDEYFIVTILKKLSFFCEKIFIITGFNAELLENEIKNTLKETDLLKKISFVFNPNFSKGMFSSVQTAAKELLNIANHYDYVLLHLVDQPQISLTVYELLVKSSQQSENTVIIPSFQHKSGHPILLKKPILQKISNSETNETLRNILEKEKKNTLHVNVADSAIIKDANTDNELKNLNNQS
ncbi:MAG: NTP transferase domain-containing protein [Candidatus Cloacimonetes bacterium]|nr:NTP transferase domain-containing protein [Candidatus Cloacimonadota bacterium]